MTSAISINILLFASSKLPSPESIQKQFKDWVEHYVLVE